MTREKMKAKYVNAVAAICREYGCDLNVGYDMLVSSVKGHFGLTYTADGKKMLYDEYKGVPVDFDYTEFLGDYIQLIAD